MTGQVFDDEAAARLRRVITRLARAMNAPASTEDLTPTQASVLAVVHARGPLRLGALAELEGINPTMLSRVVGALEGFGLLHRRPDEADQRSVVVDTTDAGREKSARIRDRRTQVLTRVVGTLPPDTAASLLTGLPALEALTEAFPGRAASPARRG